MEIVGVTQVTHKACPLRVSLDRVVLTSTGVVLGLWQVGIRPWFPIGFYQVDLMLRFSSCSIEVLFPRRITLEQESPGQIECTFSFPDRRHLQNGPGYGEILRSPQMSAAVSEQSERSNPLVNITLLLFLGRKLVDNEA